MNQENELFRGGQGRSARSVREDGETLMVFVVLAIVSLTVLAIV